MFATRRFNLIRKFSTAVEVQSQSETPHIPVMVEQVLQYLKPEDNQTILDMTFGAGGHSRKILNSASNIKLIAVDRDPVAFDYASEIAKEYPEQVKPILGRFSELPKLLKGSGVLPNSVDCILFDFGCSSMQFDTGSRGFSISKNGPLDMRMDGDRYPDSPTAADILERASEEDLYKIIKYYGEERQARKIARAVVEARYLFKKLQTTEDLCDLVGSVTKEDFRLDKLRRRTHVATKTFQALRIFVNNELNEINYGLLVARRFLKVGGRLATLTFHSLEDTIVKRHLSGNVFENAANALPLKYCGHDLSHDRDFLEQATNPNWKMLHKHVLVPDDEEVERNPRSRSAKLRAAVRVK